MFKATELAKLIPVKNILPNLGTLSTTQRRRQTSIKEKKTIHYQKKIRVYIVTKNKK